MRYTIPPQSRRVNAVTRVHQGWKVMLSGLAAEFTVREDVVPKEPKPGDIFRFFCDGSFELIAANG